MKNKCILLTQLLGLSEISLKGSILGGKPTASLTEMELEKIEAALQASADTEALRQKIETLEAENRALKTEKQAVESAVQEALILNDVPAGKQLSESIAALGKQCKEYGGRETRHTFPKNNGKETHAEGIAEGYFDPKDAHNQI